MKINLITFFAMTVICIASGCSSGGAAGDGQNSATSGNPANSNSLRVNGQVEESWSIAAP